jgi:lipopolysaccharide transport system ATP-binding protein
MANDIVIRAEGLGKSYLIGHQAERERYTALRDVIARSARGFVRSAADMIRGRQLVAGDDVEEFWALKGISFEIKRGDAVAIIGRNGAGKSTLLKILSRITEPTEGRVEIKGRVASLLEVGTGFHPELTGRENIYLNGAILGMTRAETKRKFDEIVAFAEVEKFIDTPVKRYSSGMYVRLAFAVAAHLEPEILVVDEVLAVGDAEFQKKCLGKMGDVVGSGRTVLFVSHNMVAARKLCESGILLDNGKVTAATKVEDCIDRYLATRTRLTKKMSISSMRSRKILSISLSIFNGDGIPIEKPRTFQKIIFRIGFDSLVDRLDGGVEIYFSLRDGTLLSRCSSRPDSNFPMSIARGFNQVDCVFNSIPLSAGVYVVGIGISVPNTEWLFNDPFLADFEIDEQDVFESGQPPRVERYPIAMSHSWRRVD